MTPVFSKLVLIRLLRKLIEVRRECEGVCVCGVRGMEGPSRNSLLRSIWGVSLAGRGCRASGKCRLEGVVGGNWMDGCAASFARDRLRR